MITCTELERKGQLLLSSTTLHKDAIVTFYGFGNPYWNLKHLSNGRMKNFKEYKDVLEYLTKKGW